MALTCAAVGLMLLAVVAVLLRHAETKERLKYQAEMAARSAGPAKYYLSVDKFDYLFFRAGWIAAVTASVGVVVATWWGMYPWVAEYHQWVPYSGRVATVDSRLVSSGENASETKYVVTFAGNSQQYGVLDTRMASVRPGDSLSITCVRRWQWSGSHGYDCNFSDFHH